MKNQFPQLERLYLQAVELHHQGNPQAAVPLYRQIVQTIPDADVVHYNLGLALYEQEQFEEAVQAFLAASQANPQDADTWFNLGLSYKQLGRTEQAEAAYLQALEFRPGDLDILYNLGCAYQADDDAAKACVVYELLLEQEPTHLSALGNLAYLEHKHGEYEKAMHLYRRLLEINPDDERAVYLLASLEGEAIAAPPEEYVKELFDQYSENFEQSLLDDLEYQVPELIDQLLARRTGRQRAYKRVLDLGCGTGLAGERLTEYAHFLAGMDISEGMLTIAREKKIYNQLTCCEAVTYLRQSTAACWDLVVAADVLTYIGDLSPLFSALTPRLSAKGLFCFTTEHSSEDASWSQGVNGRYGHSRSYIKALAATNGLRLVSAQTIKKRKEAGQWILGVLWFLAVNDAPPEFSTR